MYDYTNEQVEHLCWKIEELTSELTLERGKVIKQRGDILQLKSHIGHLNMELQRKENNNIEIIDITYEETDRD